MAPLFLLLALPATLLATVEAAGFFRGLRPLPMPLPIMPLVHPLPHHLPRLPHLPHLMHRIHHPMPFPLLPLGPHPPPMMPIRRPSHSNKITTRTHIRSVPVAVPAHDRRGDVIVVINDRDCYSGLCQGGGFGGSVGGGYIDGSVGGYIDGYDNNMMDRISPRSGFSINDADHVYVGGNGRY